MIQDQDKYTKAQILNLIYERKLIRSDVYLLDVDHPVRIALYDIECAGKMLDGVQSYIFDSLIKQHTINEIANDLHTYEMNIYRKMDSIFERMMFLLNVRGL